MNAPRTNNAKRLLFVDDEEGVRASWSRYFSEKGYDVATAPSYQHALNSLAERPADVVVSDYRMPDQDGLQLLEQVREQHPETPFILLTGYGTEDLASEALRKGAYAYLRKPVDPETLTGMLTSALDFRVARGEVTPRAAKAIPLAAVAAAAPAVAVATAVAATPAQQLATTAAVEAAVATRARIIGGLKVAGSMVAAPIVGLAFVIFFPVIGFAAFFKVVGEAVWGMFQKGKVQPRAEV